MANHKRKRPRTKSCGFSDYKHMARKAGGEENLHNLYGSCDSGWNTLFHIRPHRRDQRAAEKKIISGADPDDVLFPVFGKPHKYYW